MTATADPARKRTAAAKKPRANAPRKRAAADAAGLDPALRAPLDAAIAELDTGARAWTLLTLGQRRTLITRLRATTAAVAEEWAEVAALSKGLTPGPPLRGEEWLSGPYAALVALDAYADTLGALASGKSPLAGVRTSTAPGGRTVIHTSPLTATNRHAAANKTFRAIGWCFRFLLSRCIRASSTIFCITASLNNSCSVIARWLLSIPLESALWCDTAALSPRPR